MYVPAPPAQHALALAPVDIVSTTQALTAPPLGAAEHDPARAQGQPERARRPPRQRRRHAEPGDRRAHGHPAGDGPSRLAQRGPHAHRRQGPLPADLPAAPHRQRARSRRLRRRRPRPAVAPPARAPERLSPRRGLLVRRRRRPRLRRLADERHARRRQQDASLRHAGHASLQRALRARARGRPRTVCRRTRIRPHRRPPSRHSASATPERSGARAERLVRESIGRRGSTPPAARAFAWVARVWAGSCRAWVSR